MEFYVVDPKEGDFAEWVQRVREFLESEKLEYTEADGLLYYLGDDIATPWAENSVLFTIQAAEEDELQGVIELRDVDRGFYVFSDDLDLFDEEEVIEAVGYRPQLPPAVYGFEWGNAGKCRFHLGPSEGVYFFADGEDVDYPAALELTDVWNLFFRVAHWAGNNTSRIQDLKGINVDKVHFDLQVQLDFTHPASLDVLSELLVEEEGYERTRSGLRATFRDRDLGFVRELVSMLPPEPEDFEHVLVRGVWRGVQDDEEREVFHVGVERRKLRPFVQMPVHRTSKALVDRFRGFFKGHRIDRQEYLT